eukprot:2683900-Amphidinium_carterae.1
MDERLAQLEATVQNIAGALQAEQHTSAQVQSALQADRQRVAALEEELRNRRSGGNRDPLAVRRGIEKVPTFSGKPEEFDDWKFKLVTFLSQEEGMVMFLQWAEEEPTEVTESEIRDEGQLLSVDGVRLNRELYQVLVMLLKDSALALIRNYSSQPQNNGANAWRKLVGYYAGATAQRVQGLASRVYSPQRCKNYKELVSAIESWEHVVHQFERAEKQTLGDQSLIHGIRQLVPEDLARNLQSLSHTLKSFKDVKAYILEQASSRREVCLPKSFVSDGPTPMEIGQVTESENKPSELVSPCLDDADALGLQKGFYKGKGSGGKDGSKDGKFNGTCRFCGEWGHKLAQCPKKDEEQQKKGKGGKGNWNQWGGQWYQPMGWPQPQQQ